MKCAHLPAKNVGLVNPTYNKIWHNRYWEYILRDEEDLEDYKQKIEKQRKLRKKTINSVKELLSKNENDFITSKML